MTFITFFYIYYIAYDHLKIHCQKGVQDFSIFDFLAKNNFRNLELTLIIQLIALYTEYSLRRLNLYNNSAYVKKNYRYQIKRTPTNPMPL